MEKMMMAIIAGVCAIFLQARDTDLSRMSWQQIATRMPKEWYGTDQARSIADTVIKYQCPNGGWPKNIGFHKEVNQEEMARIKKSGIGATIDNRATTTEMRFLANVYAATKDGKIRSSFIKGFDFLLEAQYDNGGWPQFYPPRKGRSVGYSSHITFNDDSIINVLKILKEIADNDEAFEALNLGHKRRARAQAALDRGIEAILKCQIYVDGQPTVWCAQHDEITFAPAGARAYELPSFSGAESVGIIQFLMDIQDPSDEVIRAINGAIRWFESHKIEGITIHRFKDENGKRDCMVKQQPGAPAQWARFYDLETGKPFFCDRDGIKKASLAEIGQERRGGYSWYTTAPQRILDAYPAWLARISK